MRRLNHARLWLCLPPLLLLALDATLTLMGQPAAYWSEDYMHVKELNPAAWFLLVRHPALFLVGVATIAGGIVAAILSLPQHYARVLSLVAAFCSAAGASSWLVEYGLVGWILVVALFWGAERMVTWSWRKAKRSESGSD